MSWAETWLQRSKEDDHVVMSDIADFPRYTYISSMYILLHSSSLVSRPINTNVYARSPQELEFIRLAATSFNITYHNFAFAPHPHRTNKLSDSFEYCLINSVNFADSFLKFNGATVMTCMRTLGVHVSSSSSEQSGGLHTSVRPYTCPF
jgi:hypothetical protein